MTKWNSTDEEKQQLKNIEQSFLDEEVKKCGNTVADYEETYKELDSLSKDMSDDWYTFLIGGSTAHVEIDQYYPGLVRMTTGEVFNYYTFTKDDVDKYFRERI